MCLAVPGKITALIDEAPLTRRGKVDFGGVLKEVNLAFVPEAMPGDYVLVHVGFAVSRIDPVEAERTLAYIDELGRDELGRAGATAAEDPGPETTS